MDAAPTSQFTLADIQQQLGDIFRRPQPLGRQLDEQTRQTIERLVAGNNRLSPIDQAEIYREQYWLRHRDALRDDFPGLHYILGEDVFDQLASDYFQAMPSTSFSLRDVGIQLAEFTEGYLKLPVEQRAVAHDMARLEWAFVEVFDAPDAALLKLSLIHI